MAEPKDGKPGQPSDLELMHKVADTVGMAPNIRLKDNLIQGAVVLGGTLLGALIGGFLARTEGAVAGGLIGMIGSTLISGLVIMVLGWIRTARK